MSYCTELCVFLYLNSEVRPWQAPGVGADVAGSIRGRITQLRQLGVPTETYSVIQLARSQPPT